MAPAALATAFAAAATRERPAPLHRPQSTPAHRSAAERMVPAVLATACAAVATRDRPAPLHPQTPAHRSAAESTGCATLARARAPMVTPEPPASLPRQTRCPVRGPVLSTCSMESLLLCSWLALESPQLRLSPAKAYFELKLHATISTTLLLFTILVTSRSLYPPS